MTNKKITELSAASTLTTADTIPVVQSGVTVKATFADLLTLLGASYQPLDSDLTALAALTTTAFGRSLLELVDAAAARTALALGTAAVAATGDFDAAGAAAAAQAASQPLDSDLTAIAALTTTAFGRSLLALADAAALAAAHNHNGTYAPAGAALRTGSYYGTPVSGVTSSAGPGLDAVVASPFWLPHATTFDRIAAEVTAAVVGSTLRLGVYGSDASQAMPGPLVLDAGTIDGNSATVQAITINLALSAGLYWLVGGYQGGLPSTRNLSNGVSPWIPNDGFPNNVRNGFFQSGVAGALPATFVVGGVVSTMPRVLVRAA